MANSLSENSKAHVLVVDDERMIADTLVTILNRSGFEALAAYSGFEAIEAAKTFCPAILLTDVNMPGMSGVDAAVAIVRELPQCRVILLAGQALTADLAEQARAMGQDFEILAKPLHPIDLIAKLRG